MTYRLIQVEPLSPHVGAEISGVDLARPIVADAFGEIRRAFGQYSVVFFRDQDLTLSSTLPLPSGLRRSTSTASSPPSPAIR
jgi:alpha-ketoglutarate-dependent taurine dioxygenase